MHHIAKLTAAALALLFGISLSTHQSRAQSAKDLVGAWAWVSLEVSGADGVKRQPFGATPMGLTIFDSDGRFVYLLAKSGRSKFASNNRDQGTAEENKETVQGSIAFSGTYSVSDKTLILNIAASTYPNAEGTQLKRIITITGDQMKVENPATTTGGAGVALMKRLK
jgi:hypothetical protein